LSVVRVQVTRLPGNDDLPLPQPATVGSAGLDLRACLAETLTIAPGARVLIPTGIALALPHGYEAQVRPRSGLALRTGLTLLNSPGTVDADYRGEIQVLVINLGDAAVVLERGDRIAQLIVHPVPRVEWEEVEALPLSARGAGGFGHTGTRCWRSASSPCPAARPGTPRWSPAGARACWWMPAFPARRWQSAWRRWPSIRPA